MQRAPALSLRTRGVQLALQLLAARLLGRGRGRGGAFPAARGAVAVAEVLAEQAARLDDAPAPLTQAMGNEMKIL